jgi:glycosyltransferase involved in cell wall biosynthesis
MPKPPPPGSPERPERSELWNKEVCAGHVIKKDFIASPTDKTQEGKKESLVWTYVSSGAEADVFLEEKTIKKILLKINNIKNIKKEIILIDDGSGDGTKYIIENHCKGLYQKKIFLRKNFGKGYALRQGFKLVSGDIVIVQDADLEYNPKDYYKLIYPIINCGAKVVYGSRVLSGAKRSRPKSLDTLARLLANHFLTFIIQTNSQINILWII